MPDVEDKDFAAGFDKAQDAKAISTEPASPEAQTKEPAVEQPAAEVKTEQTESQPVETQPKSEVEQLRDYFAAELAKRDAELQRVQAENRKNFGQIGEVKSVALELRNQIAARNPSKLDPALVEQLARDADEELPGLGAVLKKHLPAMLQGSASATAQVAKAAEAAAQAQGTPFNPDEFYDKAIAPALSKLEARVNEAAELRLVRAQHRDFDQVMKDPAFNAWLSTLPADKQTYYRESEDGLVAAEAITEFKAAKEAAKQDKSRKQNRLESAVLPQGGPRAPAETPNEDDDFVKGFTRRRTA